MDVNIIQALLVFIVAFIMGIDQFSFLESLYQPIVLGPIIGAILGNFELGIVVGGAYQLVQIGSMPIDCRRCRSGCRFGYSIRSIRAVCSNINIYYYVRFNGKS